MSEIEPVETINIDINGSPAISWSRARDLLEAGQRQASVGGEGAAPRSFWLSTSGPNGQPHIAGVGALWIDDRVWFTSGRPTSPSVVVGRQCPRVQTAGPWGASQLPVSAIVHAPAHGDDLVADRDGVVHPANGPMQGPTAYEASTFRTRLPLVETQMIPSSQTSS